MSSNSETTFQTWHDDASCGLRVQTDERVGRTYHTAHAIPSGTTVIEASSPYACTIWKQFRTEVCAECWKYDRGRRGFLTRRDDEGLEDHSLELASKNSEGSDASAKRNHQDKSGPGAGLWFCGENCQASWIAREGVDTLKLLRTLEEARRKKGKGKAKESTAADQDRKSALTRVDIERAWNAVREKERNPKEVKRWREIQLDDFETDMARYVLLALVHLSREQDMQHQQSESDGTDAEHMPPTFEKLRHFGGATWSNFAALQSNELHHLQTYPELLENQTKLYQALRGRLGLARISRYAEAASPIVAGSEAGIAQDCNRRRQEDANVQNGKVKSGRWEKGGLRELGSVVTIENVRTALSVDPGNSFGVWEVPVTEESECLGFGVYPRPSLFNHHCAPNVKKERSGRTLRFVTTRDVDADEELCISYGYVEQMVWRERRKELQEGWFFECRCSRCIADMATDGGGA